MTQMTIQVSGRERLEPAITKATPLGALGTKAIVHLGATSIRGSAAALRALADALVEAAELADAYDADPDAFNQREQANREADRLTLPRQQGGDRAEPPQGRGPGSCRCTASTRPAHIRKRGP